MPTSGRFIWYELLTTDPAAALEFYGSVIGWGRQDSMVPSGTPYNILTVQGRGVAGVMAQPEPLRATGAPPGWLGYVLVEDVDEAVQRLTALGGTMHEPPMDIPTIGRFAPVADPQSTGFLLFTPLPRDAPEPLPPRTQGLVAWHELHAADSTTALGFYEKMFGWRQLEAMDMGEMGAYRIFATGDGTPAGGIFTKPPTEPCPYWLYYIAVDDIDAASQRTTARGGKIVMGPTQVPGGDWIIQADDPQGARFALVGKRA